MSLPAGTPAPLFTAASPVNPHFEFGSLGGRWILLAFLPGPGGARDGALELVRRHAGLFHDDRLAFFGVLPDAGSLEAARHEPPFRWFGDVEGKLRRMFDAASAEGAPAPQWVLVDPSMRVLWTAPLDQGGAVMVELAALGDPEAHAGAPVHAPVLIAPRIFEPDLCERLIGYYRARGGRPTGFMRAIGGRTVEVSGPLKTRSDARIEDEALIAETRAKVARRLAPEIAKAFQFRVTRIERYLIGCYEATAGGHFRAHRDDTTPGTAHRRFAVSINLNAEGFEGGDLRFPEFGRRLYRPPTGGAVVFSCSLLHEVTPVTQGARYAFLPFLHDEPAEAVRLANLHTLETEAASRA
jgi:predicted 2-oxoglutarate/Fe(II)-dependent dioxygenase YbiX